MLMGAPTASVSHNPMVGAPVLSGARHPPHTTRSRVQHGVPARPGPVPACADSEVLTFALARELLGYDSERRFRRVLRDDWGHLFPRIPAQSELNRRTLAVGGTGAIAAALR